MKITFINVRRINPDRDGFDFEYLYTIDEDSTIHRIHVVTGSDGAELAWYISAHDKREYSKRVFSLVVDFFNSYWQKYHELPPEDCEYYETRELGKLGSAKIDWENYVLQL